MFPQARRLRLLPPARHQGPSRPGALSGDAAGGGEELSGALSRAGAALPCDHGRPWLSRLQSGRPGLIPGRHPPSAGPGRQPSEDSGGHPRGARSVLGSGPLCTGIWAPLLGPATPAPPSGSSPMQSPSRALHTCAHRTFAPSTSLTPPSARPGASLHTENLDTQPLSVPGPGKA